MTKASPALMAAVVPVCAGISLEYYFSFVDNDRYGCGTKLPHNVTGLLGVMDGHASDLRTGLPWQMVEIHEPVRILFVIETTPERLTKVMNASASLKQLVENRWIRIATIDPASGRVHVRRDGGFEEFDERRGAPASGAFFRRMVSRQTPASPHGLDSMPRQEAGQREPFASRSGVCRVGAGCGLRCAGVCCGCSAGFPPSAFYRRITGVTFSACVARACSDSLEARRHREQARGGDIRQLVCRA